MKKNDKALTLATQNLTQYFNSLHWFWRLFFPTNLANALTNNRKNQISSLTRKTWWLHRLLFSGLDTFLNVDTINQSEINDTPTGEEVDITQAIEERIESPFIEAVENNTNAISSNHSSKQNKVPLKKEKIQQEQATVETLTPIALYQNLKNSFINAATSMPPSIIKLVEETIDKLDNPTKNCINNCELIRAIEQLKNNKVISEKISTQSRSSWRPRATSIWSTPKADLTQQIISSLVGNPECITLANIYIKLHQTDHLKSDIIQFQTGQEIYAHLLQVKGINLETLENIRKILPEDPEDLGLYQLFGNF